MISSSAAVDGFPSKKDDYVWVSKEDRYYQTLIVTIFLTDPYIVVIATIVTQLFCSWPEGEERDRGDRFGERKTKHKNH